MKFPEETGWNDQVYLMAAKSLQSEANYNGLAANVPQAIMLLRKYFSDWMNELEAAKPSISEADSPSL